MSDIYICDNNRCRLRGKHLRFKGNEAGTCLSCRQKLGTYNAKDFGYGVEIVAALSRKPEPPAVKCGDGMEYDQRGEVLGKPVVEAVNDRQWSEAWGKGVVEAVKYADDQTVPVDDDVVTWMEVRDSINESFINLTGHAAEYRALYIETKLRHLNRELLEIISSAIDEEEDE
jgi:hypothetical protein